MPEKTTALNADLSPLTASLDTAAKSLADFVSGPVADAGANIETAMSRSFASVVQTIANAAAGGKTSISQMVDAMLSDFDRVATSQFLTRPVDGLVQSLIGAVLPVSGARAAGGPVSAGGSYLVGEQGPELFTPAGNGAIAPNAGAALRPQIVLNVQARDAQSFKQSESQLAAMMSRALARGQRNL